MNPHVTVIIPVHERGRKGWPEQRDEREGSRDGPARGGPALFSEEMTWLTSQGFPLMKSPHTVSKLK